MAEISIPPKSKYIHFQWLTLALVTASLALSACQPANSTQPVAQVDTPGAPPAEATPTQAASVPPPADAAPPAVLDVCALLAPEEVAQAVNALAASSASNSDSLSGAVICEYSFQNQAGEQGSLFVYTYRSGDLMANSSIPINATRLFEEMQSLASGSTTAVPGLADSAFWEGAASAQGDRYIHLHVLKRSAAGDVYFMLQMLPRPENIYAQIEDLARRIAERLP